MMSLQAQTLRIPTRALENAVRCRSAKDELVAVNQDVSGARRHGLGDHFSTTATSEPF